MRTVKYVRTEFHGPSREVENDLLAFVYDIPNFSACGICPPFHLMNQIFARGGGDGGMSPGAIWQPFQITREEFDELAVAIIGSHPGVLVEKSRYDDIQLEFDPQFDEIPDRIEWLASVCAKHRESYRRKLEHAKQGA
jgi:hypothetical protein